MVSARFYRFHPAVQVVLLALLGVLLALVARCVSYQGHLPTAPAPAVGLLGAAVGAGRANVVQRAFGGGRLDNRFLGRLLIGFTMFAALCGAVGMPSLFPLCASFTATVHLQWSGSRRWPAALVAAVVVSVVLGTVAAALDHTGLVVSPLSHDQSGAFFLAAMLLGVLTIINAVALTTAREASERTLDAERTRRHDELLYAATHDGLTGVLNRAGLAQAVEQVMPQIRPGHGVGVLYLDLDGFKAVNDTLSHAAGDELLRLAARRVQDAVRGADVVVRVGGDEFLVLAVGLDGPESLAALSHRVEAALSEPFDLTGVRAQVGASIGTVFTDSPPADPGTLFQSADAAMYQVKAQRHHAARRGTAAAAARA